VYLLFGQLIGILAPLALFTDRLFAGPTAPDARGPVLDWTDWAAVRG
jgi:hypothetical protein